jgi:pimeloyl-ACP methyl ester carboxylesterase
MKISSGDIKLYCETVGDGFPVVLLHPFPAHHGFWGNVVSKVGSRYRLVLPDLRGHGRSEAGSGAATMARQADDLLCVLEGLKIPKAAFVGVSIGGYILFEFWRRHRERVVGLVLSNTRAEPDTEQGRANRLRSIEEARMRGTGPFLDAQMQNLIGESTRRNRPDIVGKARAMMQMMTIEGFAVVQQGMAERPDSVPTLRSINVPTLVIAGEEDTLTPLPNAQLMQRQIPSAGFAVIRRGGHYAAMENPEEFARLLRQFLERLSGTAS